MLLHTTRVALIFLRKKIGKRFDPARRPNAPPVVRGSLDQVRSYGPAMHAPHLIPSLRLSPSSSSPHLSLSVSLTSCTGLSLLLPDLSLLLSGLSFLLSGREVRLSRACHEASSRGGCMLHGVAMACELSAWPARPHEVL